MKPALGVMSVRRKSKAIPRVATIPLVLASEQASRLQQLVVEASKAKVTSGAKWLTSSKRFFVSVVYQLDAQIVRVHADSIEVPEFPPLAFAPGRKLKGFNSSTDLLYLLSGPDGWAIEIRFMRPLKKKGKKKRNEPRLHSDAAIFVTKKTGYRVWSGGLPSLGKRR